MPAIPVNTGILEKKVYDPSEAGSITVHPKLSVEL